ncbi:MAG: hypothetical protein KZQ97_06535 [Candidatus Thiodiazotropha sp. (ex Dulcina madagascariensis)]|nr:hypothetical protein [Candidatus Thiodiazotropha sp. (ex Dulcina madagascariensis)]
MGPKIRSLVIALASTVVIIGCASSTVTRSDKQTSQIITDKNNSYIVFSRPEYLGAALSNTIVEFSPRADGMILVGTLRPGTKLIYKVPQGEHFFYMEGGENDDMIKINAAPGKAYYVHTEVNFGFAVGRFYFKPFRYSSETLKKSLRDKNCNEQVLQKYSFVMIEDEYNYNSPNIYESESNGLKIQCGNGRITKVEYAGTSLELLEGTQLIEKNEKANNLLKELQPSYQTEITQDYPGWAKNNYGDTVMHEDDGVPIEEI